ncbi:uncharacterized protein METZ01_LOCUS284615, partial [marine metagenome]
NSGYGFTKVKWVILIAVIQDAYAGKGLTIDCIDD